MTRRPKQTGFSLPELIIAMTISAVLIAVMASVVYFAFNIREETQQLSDLQQAGQILSTRINRDIRNSSDALVSGDGTAILLVPHDTSVYSYMIYYWSGNGLYLNLYGSTTTVVTLLGGSNDTVTVTNAKFTIRTRTITDDHDDDPDTADISSTLPTLISGVITISEGGTSAQAVVSGTLRGNLIRVRAADGL